MTNVLLFFIMRIPDILADEFLHSKVDCRALNPGYNRKKRILEEEGNIQAR